MRYCHSYTIKWRKEKMRSINIKGKSYVEVNERLKEFRSNEKYSGYSLTTEIVSIENGVVIIKAIIKDSSDRIVATGLAHEDQSWSEINSTSYIENCETSAWGRALGNLGIGIDSSVATADEVSNAISKQQAGVQSQAVRRVAPAVSSDTQQDLSNPIPGTIAVIDGVKCIVRTRKSDGGRFWAAYDPNVKFTKNIDQTDR
jgi:hypothetical protein